MSDLDFRQILELTRDAVVVGDRAGRIVYANPAAETLLRWPPGELVGKPITAIIPPGLRGKHTAGFNRHRATRAARILGRAIRVPALRRDGAEVRVELTVHAYRGGAGAEWYVASIREPGAGLEREPGGTAGPGLRELRAVLDGLTAELSDVELARRLDHLLSAHLGTTVARLYVRSAEGEALRLGTGVRPVPELNELLPRAEDDPVRAAAERRQPVIVSRMELLPYDQAWLAVRQIRSVAAFPVALAGERRGILLCLSREALSPEGQELLALAAVHLAALLGERELRRLAAAEERLRAVRSAAAELTALLAAGSDTPVLLERIVEFGVQLSGADEGSLMLRDSESGDYVVRACAGYRTPILGMSVPAGQGLTSAVVAAGAAVLVEDYQAYPQAVPRIRQRGVRAALGAPVRVRSGSVVGALKLESKSPTFRFGAEERELLELLASLAGAALSGQP